MAAVPAERNLTLCLGEAMVDLICERPGVSFGAERERQLDALGDLIGDHLDTAALLRLIEDGVPADVPFIPPGAP